MVMAAKCGKHLELLLEYQYMNQLKLLAKLNPLETVELDQLVLLVDVYQDVMAVVAVKEDQEMRAGQQQCLLQ